MSEKPNTETVWVNQRAVRLAVPSYASRAEIKPDGRTVLVAPPHLLDDAREWVASRGAEAEVVAAPSETDRVVGHVLEAVRNPDGTYNLLVELTNTL